MYVLESSPEIIPTPPPVCGKIIFHEISPWCQKGRGTAALESSGALEAQCQKHSHDQIHIYYKSKYHALPMQLRAEKYDYSTLCYRTSTWKAVC